MRDLQHARVLVWIMVVIWGLFFWWIFGEAKAATTSGITITFPAGNSWFVNTRQGDLFCESSAGVNSCDLTEAGYYRWTDTTEGSRGLYFSKGDTVTAPPPTTTPPPPEYGLTTTQLDQVNAAIETRLATIPLCDSGTSMPVQRSILFDYENGRTDSGYDTVTWTNEGVDSVDRRVVITESNGNEMIRHQEITGDPLEAGATRTESDNANMTLFQFSDGQTWDYAMSIMFPDDWAFDGIADDIVFQWKPFANGPAMFLVQKYDRLYMRINNAHTEGVRYEVTDKILQLGVWHDLRIKVVWEADNTNQGLVEVDHRVRGESYRRAFAHAGPNTFDTNGYLKWGIYKPAMSTSPVDNRTIYHDNIRISLLDGGG